MKPTVLIATTSRWFPTARLAAALMRAGCTVDAACVSSHPMARLRGLRKVHAYGGLMPLRSLAKAIRESAPGMIVPGDDLATSHLHRLYDRELQRGAAGAETCALIEGSLGSAANFPVVYARAEFIELACKAGVRAPRMEVIGDLDALRQWTASSGFPTVLKANGTSGGEGVRVVHNAEQAEQAFRLLQSPPSLLRALKRAAVDHDKSLLWPSLSRTRPLVNAQEFVPGREATSAAACWRGEVLASLHFEVLNKRDAAGPSSVVRLTENSEMVNAVSTMVRRLNLSGLHGFDFMLEADTGRAHLIEINPRSTQVGHLNLGVGRDLPAALCAALTGAAVRPAPVVTVNDTIALFPQEWMRDPRSPFLKSAYHDVPWDEPELLSTFPVKPQRPRAAKELPAAPVGSLSTARLRRS